MRALGIIALVALAGASVSGCGVAAKVESRNEYQASAAAYKECLKANPTGTQNCEGPRLAMETDERKYNNLSAGLSPNGQQSAAAKPVVTRQEAAPVPQQPSPFETLIVLWRKCVDDAFQRARATISDKNTAAEMAFQACATEEQTATTFALDMGASATPIAIAKLTLKRRLLDSP